ncbi:lasso peptide biosynthesis B2 protein [Oscillatoria sp. FACHB-1406]|uniref:lasso peptide biosynthesis B2 protein n=1 Tax=Oscillatoria sp. FACHB-1406 TaxID=2692846 RepID=UPI001682C0E2|nr:lasso peptide biosynthesis B2 protein [Oscillatoria sp. FACHB-1406]MBD2576892.1 lasso peptide biosynthesis B2 protein [Oscillatoria sp. FACHB-1406]
MKKLYRLARLNGRDRVLFLQAAFLLAIVKLGLTRFSFQTLHRWLAKIFSKSTPKYVVPAEKILWAVETASRNLPGGAKCLNRALVAQTLLARQGYPARLRIGVAKNACGQLEAHAWVENEERILVGRLVDGERFVPLADFEF